jgi:hypothetical protein
MTRSVVLAGIAALALASNGPSAGGQQRRPIDLESDCDANHYRFGDDQVATATDRVSVPLGAGALDIRPDGNGGVRIEHTSGSAYTITACIGAGARTQADAQAAADGIHLEVSGSRVRLRDDGQTARAHTWSAQIVVGAPDGASVTAQTSNGPIGVHDFNGTLDVRASNGPISIAGGRGEFDVETSNGPIDIRLDGDRWDGHLTAQATNGPLTVAVPAGYQSGVEVRSSSHSPWSCRADACRAGNRDWDEGPRLLRIGGDPIVVRLSTVNGPVTVRDGR